MNPYYVIPTIFEITQGIVTDSYLLHKWFRYNVPLTIILNVAASIFIYIICPVFDLFDTTYQYAGVQIVIALASLLFIKREKVMLAIIVNDMAYIIYNVAGITFMVMITNLYGLLTGRDPGIWFTIYDLGLPECIMKSVSACVICFVTCMLMKKIIPFLEKLERPLQILLCIMLMIPVQGYLYLREFIFNPEEDALTMVYVMAFVFFMIIPLFCISLFLIILFTKSKFESRKMQEDISMQIQYYQNILELQEQLREIKHDISNIVAVSSEENKATIKNYCREVKETFKL